MLSACSARYPMRGLGLPAKLLAIADEVIE
jgi:hypothetical protein